MSPSAPARSSAPFLMRTDRPKILYVIQQRDVSGAETAHAAMLRADADPLIACPAGGGSQRFAELLGVPSTVLPFRALRHSGGPGETLRSVGRGLLSALDLRRVLRAHPDREIIVCTSLRPGMLCALAAVGLGRRRLWIVPDHMPPEPLATITRNLARVSCDRAVTLSQSIADSFVGRSRALGIRTRVIYPGVDVPEVAPAAPTHDRVAVVGHVSPLKRTELALDVVQRLASELPGLELHVIGAAQFRDEDFAYERALRERVATHPDLRASVRFRGRLDDVPAALREASMLLHCRTEEPFGMVLIEAMAAGLPVIAPRSAGPAEIVVEGETGLLYEPGDADAAAASVRALVRDPERAARMGAAGRRRVQELFTTRAQLAGYDRALAALAGRRP